MPVSVDADDPRSTARWRDVGGGDAPHTPYLVHDADPLAAVADAWVRYYDEQGPIGELEVAVAETLARWRVGSIELPDYYLVLDAESWGATRRHWYLGVLHGAAPARGGAGARSRRRRARSRAWARERGGRISTTCSGGSSRSSPDQPVASVASSG